MSTRRQMIDRRSRVPLLQQCRLLDVPRSSAYYRKQAETPLNVELRAVIASEYEQTPVYGVRRMTALLRRRRYVVNRKRIARLYRQMGLRGLIAKRLLSKRNKRHPVYPYLLKNLAITRTNQVWATDITYIPARQGYWYLMAIIDHQSRYVLGWGISNTLEADFCRDVLVKALAKHPQPEIVNTDQGCQFTSLRFTQELKDRGIAISMDSKGRALDNIVIERFWKTLKYEHLYVNEYIAGPELVNGLQEYFEFYNNRRLHQSLGYRTPGEVYRHEPEHSLTDRE
jgi:putative transposase